MYDFRHLNDLRQLSVQLLHYVRLDGYDFIIRNRFCSCCFEKNITDIIFKIPIGSAQSSIVSLKKRTVKQIASVLPC